MTIKEPAFSLPLAIGLAVLMLLASGAFFLGRDVPPSTHVVETPLDAQALLANHQ